jgi:hypothetical protein
MSLPRGALAAMLLMLPACVYDGAYRVQGTVRTEASRGELEPLSGAEVVTRNGRAGEPQRAVMTAEDGSYRAEYQFGGMGFLFFTPGVGDPHVAFTAPGFQTTTVPLRGEKTEAGVTRRRCDEPSAVNCFGIDVVLLPASK